MKALTTAADTRSFGDTLAIAPEGTRSTTGQLLQFKKGPFHIWEEFQTPIVPIVTFGAFDLYPPGRQMTHAGKVIPT